MSGVALVTGGAVRIGRAIALRLAADGYSVAIHYRNSSADAVEVARLISEAGGNAASFHARLENHEDICRLIPAISETLGPVTCLVNNASLFRDDNFQTMTREDWDVHMNVNLRTPLFLAQRFAAQLPPEAEGNIINIIDQRVMRPNPMFFSYTISKAALWAATQTLAQALAPRIRVNAIGPGPVLRSIHQTSEDFSREWRSTLLGRGAAPEEIAEAVAFILNSPSMTGQMLALDGGQHLLWQTPDIPIKA
jgi:NAD(P)-dependent dehydrogenase (short-subunit alcohol dehydrogenase family)